MNECTNRWIMVKYCCCCSATKPCPTLQSHGLQHTRPLCPSWPHRVCSSSCPLNQWCHPTMSSCVTLFSSCPQSLPASGSFPMSWLFTSGGQSIGASALASVLLANIQGWFSLGLTGLISPQSREHSRVFSSTTIWKHQFFGTQPSLWSSFHIHMTTGKPIALTIGPLLAKWCLCLVYVIYLNIHKNYWRSC